MHQTDKVRLGFSLSLILLKPDIPYNRAMSSIVNIFYRVTGLWQMPQPRFFGGCVIVY